MSRKAKMARKLTQYLVQIEHEAHHPDGFMQQEEYCHTDGFMIMELCLCFLNGKPECHSRISEVCYGFGEVNCISCQVMLT